MDSGAERIANEEHRRFVVDVGHAIQNFGVLEFLVNHMISSLVNDPVLCRTVVELPISKRLAVLEQLLVRMSPPLAMGTDMIKEVFAEARSVFRERNKIAHNPFVAEETPLTTGPAFRTGILVIRFHEDGQNDEWIDLPSLKATIRRSHGLQERLQQIENQVSAQQRSAA